MFELPDYYKPIGLSKWFFYLVGNGAYGAVATAFDNRLPEDQR
jgi:hypothetical protein